MRRRVRVCEFYLLPNCTNGLVADASSTESGVANGVQVPNRFFPVLRRARSDAASLLQVQLSNLQRLMPGERDPAQQQQQPALGEPPAATAVNVPADAVGSVRLYDESSDSFVVLRYDKILDQCRKFIMRANNLARRRPVDDPLASITIPEQIGSVLLLRPNIEHYMLGMIMGKGGSVDDLGATLWGQTELSCFDDGQHGVWGM